MSDKLLPCPHCHSDDAHVIKINDYNHGVYYIVTCGNVACQTSNLAKDEEVVIKRWNTRPIGYRLM
jgi:transcription initiation factor TFIIIB Brf1 subunit/transcription initiation factor TFIIB